MNLNLDYNKKRIPTVASTDEIAYSVNETLKEINLKGETPELELELYFKYARLKFSEGDYDKAKTIFGQCNSITIDNGLPENYEIYYWTGRIMEAKGDIENARLIYGIALKRCKDNPNLIPRSEILEANEKHQ